MDAKRGGRSRHPERFGAAFQRIEKFSHAVDFLVPQIDSELEAVNDVRLLDVSQFLPETDLQFAQVELPPPIDGSLPVDRPIENRDGQQFHALR